MSRLLFRCRECGYPHEVGTRTCPITNRPVTYGTPSTSMPAVPPPTAAPSTPPAASTAAPSVPPPPSSAVRPAVPRPKARTPVLTPPPRARSVPPPPSVATPPAPSSPAIPIAPIPALPGFRPRGTRPPAGVGDEPDDLLGYALGGRYQINQVIGEGAMGVVYSALDLEHDRPVAVKTLTRAYAADKTLVARLKNEARMASSLGHPNIITMFDMGELPDGAPYVVMELLRGETLGRRLKRLGLLPVPDVVGITARVLSALAAAHKRGVVHRDIKPENVFLLADIKAPGGGVKVLDFGTSKLTREARHEQTGVTLTRVGSVVGTPGYMAPEQAGGDREFDGRTDLYMVGVMMYEMLVGRRPYRAQTPHELMVEMNSRAPTPIDRLRPEVPGWLQGFVVKLMALDRDERPASAEEALAEVMRGGAGGAGT